MGPAGPFFMPKGADMADDGKQVEITEEETIKAGFPCSDSKGVDDGDR